MTSSTVLIAPMPFDESGMKGGLSSLSDVNPYIQAMLPAATGTFEKAAVPGAASSISAQLNNFLNPKGAEFTDNNATQSAFTTNLLDVKNQARVSGFIEGSSDPSLARTFSLAPAMVNFNTMRLNDGEPIRPNMATWRLRETGSAWNGLVQANTWAAISEITTTTATADPQGFAQVNHNGAFFSEADATGWKPERGQNQGGFGWDLGTGNINSGAGFDKTDGAAGGELAFAEVSIPKPPPFTVAGASGAGALAVPMAYGIDTLLNVD